MKKIKILNWLLQIDYKKTVKYYKSLPYITEGCNCNNCKNYVTACDLVPFEIKNLSERLGIDLKKASDLFYCMDYDDGTCLYWAGYTIIGKIIEGTDKVQDIVVNENNKFSKRIVGVPEKQPFIEGFEVCFYTMPPVSIDDIEYPAITLDFNGKFLQLHKES